MANYPFTAIVGSDDLALALLLTTISPEVGGVLVRGEKGTAKSTTVRALADILPPLAVVPGCRFSCDPAHPDPHCPDGPHPHPEAKNRPARLVELPVGATDDRVTGSLDLQQALGHGQANYQPGLLAQANRGLLYVDEVNLLHDHLVDLLLDAAAMGRATVERDGVSVSHAARIILVGTMNPEEGELRPQLLDRFGLTVEVTAPKDPKDRAEVVRRRLAFDADPEGFLGAYADAQADLVERLARARELLPQVILSDTALVTIAKVCAAFEVDGLRADLVTARAAVANAAFNQRLEVTKTDIRVAARLALPHRRRRNPFDAPGLDEDLLDRLLDEADPEEPEPPKNPDDPNGPSDPGQGPEDPDPSDPENPERPETSAPDSDPQTPQGGPESPPASQNDQAPTVGFANTGQPTKPKLLTARRLGHGEPGKRSRAETSIGRPVGATEETTAKVHLPATIRAAAISSPGEFTVTPDDLRHARLEGKEANLIVFCVDASGSMAARRRMTAVKTAILSLMLDAYRRRDKVALITFSGTTATLVLPPTNSVEIAATRLKELPHGGRTPLAEGLNAAWQLLSLERIKDPQRRPLLVLVTDGRANAYPGAVRAAQELATQIAGTPDFRSGRADAIVIDAETGRMRLGLAKTLAERLEASYLPLSEVTAEALETEVRHALATRDQAEVA